MATSDNRASQLVVVTIVFVTLSIFSAAVRLYTRLRLLKWVGLDDMLIFIATGAALSEALGNLMGTQYGLGQHIEGQPTEWREPYAIATIVSSLSYSISAMFVKLSLLSFYLRLSREPLFRNLTYALIFISTTFVVSSIMAAAFQCVPLSKLWDSTQPGHCINVTAFYFANAALHIVTEVLIYALPIHTLWNLQLPLRQKMGLMGLMSIGAGLIVVSCYRIITIRDLLASSDFAWNIVTPLVWYTVELNLAIFIACGPAFLAFFRHYFPAVFGGSSSRTKYRGTEHKGSYPLGSFPRDNKSGVRTMVTANGRSTPGTGTTMGKDNSSEEFIFRGSEVEAAASTGGITKQVDVWVAGESVDVGTKRQSNIKM